MMPRIIHTTTQPDTREWLRRRDGLCRIHRKRHRCPLISALPVVFSCAVYSILIVWPLPHHLLAWNASVSNYYQLGYRVAPVTVVDCSQYLSSAAAAAAELLILDALWIIVFTSASDISGTFAAMRTRSVCPLTKRGALAGPHLVHRVHCASVPSSRVLNLLPRAAITYAAPAAQRILRFTPCHFSYQLHFLRYVYGTAVQSYGSPPPCDMNDNSTMCFNYLTNAYECCTEPCEVLGTGIPIWSVMNPNNPMTGESAMES